METIKLFRGDNTKIAEFKTKQTSKYGLLGSGIYLTESAKIAQTYRTKSDTKTLDVEISKPSDGSAFNRLVALEQAYVQWLYTAHYDECNFKYHSRTFDRTATNLDQLKSKYRRTWQDMVDRGQIATQYIGNVIRVWEKPTTNVGYVSVFEFFSEEFESSVFKVDGDITDPEFLEFAKESKIFEDTPRKFDLIRTHNSNISWDTYDNQIYVPTTFYCRCSNTKTQEKIRSHLKKRGFKGMEYSGGVVLGGYGLHRAFCVWDDDWVNYHKTNRYK